METMTTTTNDVELYRKRNDRHVLYDDKRTDKEFVVRRRHTMSRGSKRDRFSQLADHSTLSRAAVENVVKLYRDRPARRYRRVTLDRDELQSRRKCPPEVSARTSRVRQPCKQS